MLPSCYVSSCFDNQLLDLIESGFVLFCTDINECNIGAHNCSSNAFCSDNDGSYLCSCIPGYEGDGYTCTSKLYICTCVRSV